MKKILFLALFVHLSFSGFTQNMVSGSISDGSTLEPLENVLVLVLKDGEANPVGNTKSDKEGKYRVRYIPEDGKTYQLVAKFLGYETFEVKLNADKKSQKFVIDLPRGKNLLKDINVSGTRARAIIKGEDTIEYDAKAFKVHKDANAEDLVAKMPGITRDASGVKSNGEQIQKVLVDGQEFFGEDANIALKNLPAETIDKVEIVDAMNDRSAFTGFNDGNTTKTMNLKTKMGKNKGNFGKAYAGYGTNNRYQGGGNFNYYDGPKRISMLGLVNNINNLNFSTSELVGAMTGSSNMGGSGGAQMMRGMSFGMSVSGAPSGSGRNFMGPMSNFTVSNQSGINDVVSFGMNYNDIWGANKKVKSSMSYFGNRTDNFTNTINRRRNLIDTANTLNSDINSENRSTQFTHRFNSRIEGELDPKNSYVWTNRLELNDNNSGNFSSTTNFFKEGIPTFLNINQSDAKSLNVSYNTNFLYRYKFERKGRTLSLNTIFDLGKQDGASKQNILNEAGGIQSRFGLEYNTNQWNTTITNVITYTEPSGKYGQWLINYSPSLSNRKNNREVLASTPFNPSPTLADSLSNRFTNSIFYNVGGISYRLQFSKLRIMFGSSVQNIEFKGDQEFPSVSTLKREFFGVLPYFNIQYSPQKMTKLRLSYNTSMNVPNLTYIQPVVDVSNPNQIFRGNENLVNEYNHNLFFHYMKPNIVKGTFFIVVSNISLTSNRFSNFSYSAIQDTAIDGVNLRRGVQYTKYVNLDGAFNGLIFANWTQPFKPLKSNFTINGSFNYNQTPSIVNLEKNITRTYMYSLGSMLTSNMNENIDFSFSYNPKYFINDFSLSGLPSNNFWIHTVGSNARITFLKNLVWSYDFSYNYNSQIDPGLNQHIFLLGSSLAYKFLKNRNLEAKFTVFDLLNQNQNINRNVINTVISDSRTNAMNRYGLFTLTYSFKKFSGKDPDKNSSGFFNMMKPKED